MFLALFLIFFYIFYVPKPITTWNFYGVILNFRVDLREASKIPVYPSEDVVNTQLMNPLVKNITIVYKPSSPKDNSYYAAEAFEIATKLYYGYRALEYEMPKFITMNVSSYENLPGKIQNPIIALVAPSYSNETAVVVDPGHIVFIKAKNLQEFDLATVKFLMSALRIKV
jgi:hypothetical protein